MSIPNIQQQLYLKKALNEDTDGMFDHPTLDSSDDSLTEDLKESYGHRLSYYGETPTLAQIKLTSKYGPEGYSAIVKAVKSHKGPLAFNINDVHRVGTAAKKAAQARADANKKSSK